jgi:hypothetical protein
MSDSQDLEFDPEREKIMIEREKLNIEREKLKLERFKSWWTGISIVIPIIVAVAGIFFSIWSLNQQAKLQSEIQAQQERSQFEIKAAEIVMSSEGPIKAQAKARALANLFPDRLPPNFAASFNPALYIDNQEASPSTGLSNRWNQKLRSNAER